MLARTITEPLLAALTDTPVVALHGARQVGKSTLARMLSETVHPATYYTLDDADVRDAAVADAAGFVSGLAGPVVIDEVQRAPDLLLAVKAAVDRDRSPGRFLLTGSAQILQLPRLADTLAGRIEVLTLWPFTQGELAGVRDCLIEQLFSDTGMIAVPEAHGHAPDRSDLVARLLAGGYPEALERAAAARRAAWFRNYVLTVTERTVRDVAEIAGLAELRRLLAALAVRSGSPVNYADLSRTLGIPQSTIKRYVALLQLTFLLIRVPAWHANLTSRLVKTARAYVADSGLLLHLLGSGEARLRADPALLGQALESFVVAELTRQAGWSRVPAEIFHFRTHTGREVDLVLEDPSGGVVGVEVKLTASPSATDFRGLEALADAAGERFQRGVVLCLADAPVPFGPRMQTLPLRALWAAT
jgi:hypothetical protein